MLCLGNVNNLLDVTPSNPLPHPIPPPPNPLLCPKDLVAKHHPTNARTYLPIYLLTAIPREESPPLYQLGFRTLHAVAPIREGTFQPL